MFGNLENKIKQFFGTATVLGSVVLAGCSGTPTQPTGTGTIGGPVVTAPGSAPSPIPNPSPQPTSVPYTGESSLAGLLYGTPGSGKLIIPDKGDLELAFNGGRIKVTGEHGLKIGDVYQNVDIIPDFGVRRRTPIKVTEEGLYVPNGNSELLPLDYVEDSAIFAKFIKIRYDNVDSRVAGLHRVNSHTGGRLRAFLYDNSLWKLENNVREKIQDNVPIRDDIKAAVIDVVHNDFEIYSDRKIPNGGLVLESRSSERPKYGDDGWIIYMVGHIVGNNWVVSQNSNGNLFAHPGDITSSILFIDPRNVTTNSGRSAISVDTFESFGANNYDGTNGYLPVDRDGKPTAESRLISKIRFNRLPLNTTLTLPNGERILDYQR